MPFAAASKEERDRFKERLESLSIRLVYTIFVESPGRILVVQVPAAEPSNLELSLAKEGRKVDFRPS